MFKEVKEIRDLVTNQLKGYIADGLFIPVDTNNRHYRKLLKYINQGGKVIKATEKERFEYLKNKMLKKLNRLADEKLQQAMNYIAGKEVSEYQLKRYEIKYQEAIKALQTNDYSFFEAEAKLLEMNPKDLAKIVKEKGDKWKQELNKLIALIEAYRVKAQNVLKNDVDTIVKIFIFDKYLEQAENLTAVTSEELENIFIQIEKDFKESENER